MARARAARGESYVAGAAALNAVAGSARISRDPDLFHDTVDAVNATFVLDRDLLDERGYTVTVTRDRPGYVEAVVGRGNETLILQWTRDSAFRFFPLVEHPDLGLTLHPVDLATNKVLALVGRLEVRDWVDVITCDERIQPLGYLAWAASGKDPGFSPLAILEQAARSSRYSAEEVATLSFAGPVPDPGDLSRRWHALLSAAREIIAVLPPEHAGECVLGSDGLLFKGDVTAAAGAVAHDELRFHRGRIRGAWPQFSGPDAELG